MKATTRNSWIASVGIALGFVGLLGPLFGWPQWTLAFFAAFPIALWTVIWLQRRDKRRGVSSPTPSAGQPFGTRVLSLLLLVVGTLSGVWWLPFTGVHLDFRQRVVTSVISCVITVGVYLLGWWYAARKA
jgi:hypothetical protein